MREPKTHISVRIPSDKVPEIETLAKRYFYNDWREYVNELILIGLYKEQQDLQE